MGLCESTLPQKGRTLRPQEKDVLKSLLIVFVVGGPGCGKGTQCRNMATKYGFCHVGLGQLLREEAQRSTKRGRKIRDIMQQGLLVPTGLILDMVSDSLLSHPESSGFLIDGFPRKLEQAKEFERIVGRAPNVVMVFDCSMETMVRRVLRRGQAEHRADDSKSTIYKRLETHYTLCEPVLAFYQQKNLLRNILAEEAPESIFAKCCLVIESAAR
ncbi:Adenylate kinase isoenzyme 1 [Lemmus lemmus]